MAAKYGTGTRTTSSQALFEEAVTLQRQGKWKSAIKNYKKLLKAAPDHPQILNMCALATAELGDLLAAVKLLQKAVDKNPDFSDGWINLGVMLQKSGENKAALTAYGRFCTLQPDLPAGHFNFANVCQLLERYDDAIIAYERALAIAPDNPGLWSNLSRASLHAGDWEKTLNATERALALSPGNTGALAIKSTALVELGRSEDVAGLVDFDRLIEKQEFEPPEGFADLKSFNEALCTHCLAHKSLEYEPSENTTMNGHQTGNLSLDLDQGPIAHLLEMIGKAVRSYQESHPIDPSHPFLSQRPEHWKYDIWATVLGSQGHQAPHIHRSGWLSGCYYAKIPDVITAESKTRSGWIEFGRPQEYPMSKAVPQVRSYQPHEGMVVLFPSYFYHRTEPFESSDQRISIAFDIVPQA
jgi:uncharacterized protein (TIGR02466 family)